MSRLVAAMKTDVTVQVRNNLYAIGVSVGALIAVAISQLANPARLSAAIPAAILLLGGGSTMLYVAGMMIFEKEEGTLHAVIVSPLRTSEYLWSKILTLTALATLESAVIIVGALLIMSRSAAVAWPNIPLLLLGIIAIGVLFTLIGIVLVVRYNKITDFLVPMTALTSLLQIPFLHFWGVVEHPAFLLIPTSAPTMLMQGAFVPLTPWEWFYAIGYTTVLLVGLTAWAYRAFETHVVMKIG